MGEVPGFGGSAGIQKTFRIVEVKRLQAGCLTSQISLKRGIKITGEVSDVETVKASVWWTDISRE